jgi:hypothetical protein
VTDPEAGGFSALCRALSAQGKRDLTEAHGAQVAQVFNPLDDIELLLEWNVLDLGRMSPVLRNQCQFERYEGCF